MRAWWRRQLRRQFCEGSQAELSGLHDLQSPLVRSRQVRSDDWRRTDQQSWAVFGFAAADQRCDGRFGHALLHGESRRSVQGLGYVGTFDWMPSQYITFRWEYNHRAANVPYFSGSGGVTPPGGNTGAAGSMVCLSGFTTCNGSPTNTWLPDLRKTENRLNMAILVKF